MNLQRHIAFLSSWFVVAFCSQGRYYQVPVMEEPMNLPANQLGVLPSSSESKCASLAARKRNPAPNSFRFEESINNGSLGRCHLYRVPIVHTLSRRAPNILSNFRHYWAFLKADVNPEGEELSDSLCID